jgi:hypothetical protein
MGDVGLFNGDLLYIMYSHLVYILWPFGTLYGDLVYFMVILVYFMAIWYTLW